MARSRKHGRDKWAEAELPLTPAPWEVEDIRQRLVDVALGASEWTRGLAADAANEIEYLRMQEAQRCSMRSSGTGRSRGNTD